MHQNPQVTELLSSFWRDIISIAGFVLGLVSIFITILIFRITAKTSQRILEESVKRAFKIITDPEKYEKMPTELTDKQKNKLLKRLKRHLKNNEFINAVEFVILLKHFINEEQAIQMIYYWRKKEFIVWNGRLENSTLITILSTVKIYESINT